MMISPILRLCRLAHAVDLPLPAYQTDAASGLDLLAAIADDAPVTLEPRARAVVATGVSIELPSGHEGQVRPRSGLAVSHGLSVLNAPGTIDADYRGEVKVILINLGDQPFVIRRGMRIAQLVIAPVTRVRLEDVDKLSDTTRGTGGFGSTGCCGGDR